MRKITLLSLFFLIAFGGLAQKEDSLAIRKISDDILKNGKAYENLYYLCKKIGAGLAALPMHRKRWRQQ
jgi:hypothetical protein